MLPLNFMKTGLMVLSDRKTPRLNLMMPVPLEFPPSGKTVNLGNWFVYSIIFWRCITISTVWFLASSLLPLGINIQSTAYARTPTPGTSLRPLVGAKLHSKQQNRMIASSHETWFTTIVEVYLDFRGSFL